MTNKSGTLYVGMTNNLERRILEHKEKRVPGFTSRYNIDQLIFYEAFPSAYDAIAAEKRIKGWKREKKAKLITSSNLHWEDLSAGWLEEA